MTHKVVMSSLHVTADDNFIRHNERCDLRVFFSAQDSPRASSLSVHMHQCQNLPLDASLDLLVLLVMRKLLVNYTRVYTVSSSMEGRAGSMLSCPE